MKRVISILMLLIVLFLVIEIIVTKFTKNHTVSYTIKKDDINFNIKEDYYKKYNDTYSIEINYDKYNFYYLVDNNYNKQKEIINDIMYFKDNDNLCIYPVLKDKQETYILCSDKNNIYSTYTYPNQDFINTVKNTLIEKKYITIKESSKESKSVYDNSTIYTSNLNSNDKILLWKYKGIDVLTNNKNNSVYTLKFDKYENKVGHVAGKYYIIPNYDNQKVLEFNSVTAINLNNFDKKTIDLDMTLSSDTYVNGVVDDKLYYTDPSNLLQVEINPSNSDVKLIGDTSMGGQMYNGTWSDRNIYDFKNGEIKYRNELNIGINYKDVKEGNGSYYLYTDDGKLYQVLCAYPDKPILLYKTDSLTNFNVVENDIYYVIRENVYNFNIMDGNRIVMTNNDLLYNSNNRVEVYRKK